MSIPEIEDSLKDAPPVEPISKQEIKVAIAKLKRKKTTGPDQIPNEVFIEADEKTRKIDREVLNKLTKSQDIPEEWQECEFLEYTTAKERKINAQMKEVLLCPITWEISM